MYPRGIMNTMVRTAEAKNMSGGMFEYGGRHMNELTRMFNYELMPLYRDIDMYSMHELFCMYVYLCMHVRIYKCLQYRRSIL